MSVGPHWRATAETTASPRTSERTGAVATFNRYRHDPEVVATAAFFALACIGWATSAAALAIAGMLGTLTTVALWLWQRYCLTSVGYQRSLSEARASFGEQVVLELELVNDKLLPLSWLEVDDTVPAGLPIEGATVLSGGRRARSDTLVQIRPLIPYQRVRRRFNVRCERRGDHAFGPGELRSGDPLRLRERSAPAPGEVRLLVYPKVFPVVPAMIVSRVLLGEQRTRRELLEDPSRAVGVRQYRSGDPLRRLHWRASARTSSLLVREFEPTVSLRVALFVDLTVPGRRFWDEDSSELEFTIAVAASLLSEFDRVSVPIGLYVAGTVGGHPLVLPASATAAGLPRMLGALARVEDRPGVSFAGLVASLSGRLQHGTSVIALANSFGGSAMQALCELRRRHTVTACLVESGQGLAPPPGTLDAVVHAHWDEEWAQREVLELST